MKTESESLGARYARNRQVAKEHGGEPGSESSQKFEVVRQFLLDVREKIASAIEAGETKFLIQLGSDGKKSENPEVYALLIGHSYDSDAAARLRTQHSPYSDLWKEFEQWAASNDLAVDMKPQHDGGGIRSWLELVCEPATPLADRSRSRQRG